MLGWLAAIEFLRKHMKLMDRIYSSDFDVAVFMYVQANGTDTKHILQYILLALISAPKNRYN